ncbi:MAG: hypothetical protein M1817_006529 [Caeruleum heppii]|nr:MAG: hypothetical protein M1817_006529 [Caeruleum heppii]
MTLALRSPHLLSSLVSVDNAPVDAALKSDFAQYVRGMKRIEEVGAKSQKRADEILKEYEESLPIRQFLLTNLYRPPSTPSDPSPPLRFRIPLRTLAQSLDHMADFPCKDPSTHRFERPSLFVRGTRSHYVADEVLPLIGEFFPAFEVRDVESGHWVVSENMEGFRKGEFGVISFRDEGADEIVAVVEFLQRRE